MLFSDPRVEQEYNRWLALIGDDDIYSRNGTVGLKDVLTAHFLILDFFSTEEDGVGVGGVGPKDMNLLHSAVYRQFTSFGGKEKWGTLYEKCAKLMFGIVKNHPFHDANKRTALLVGLLFLNRARRTPTVRQRELEDFIVDVADDKLDRYPRYREAKVGDPDAEVRFIADYLKRNTREIDQQSYTVTFNELNQILRRYGFELAAPSGGFIKVVRPEYRPKFLGILGPKIRRDIYLAQIGFPGWKKQVSRPALKTVREATGLVASRGYDSKTFFAGAEPLHSLIDTYAEPLRRLSNR